MYIFSNSLMCYLKINTKNVLKYLARDERRRHNDWKTTAITC